MAQGARIVGLEGIPLSVTDFLAFAAVVLSCIGIVMSRRANKIANNSLAHARTQARRGEFERLVVGLVRETLQATNQERRVLSRLAASHQTVEGKDGIRKEWFEARRVTDEHLRELEEYLANFEVVRAAREEQIKVAESSQYVLNNELLFMHQASAPYLERTNTCHRDLVRELMKVAVQLRLSID